MVRKGLINISNQYNKENILGNRFGKLTVVSFAGIKKSKALYKCVCDCGNAIIVRGNNLKTGTTKSCGCLKINRIKIRPIYWRNLYSTLTRMHRRCENETDHSYINYGARGIKVCSEWSGKEGYDNFYKWSMSNGYLPGLTIDRIDNDGNYEPSNCRWVDLYVQANNRRNNHYISFKGEYMTISNYAKAIGCSDKIRDVSYLINKVKLSPETIEIILTKRGNSEMNSCNFTIRLTKDIDIRYSANNMAVARFTGAVNNYKKDGNNTASFPSFIAFGKTAETLEKYVKKGQQILVLCHVQTGSYTNKDGQKIYTTDFIVDSFEFIGSKSDNGTYAETAPEAPAPEQKPEPKNDGFMNVPDGLFDEMPFA